VIRVALDAMGGDNAPHAEIDGALLAIEEYPDLQVQLVGQPDTVRQVLGDRAEAAGARLVITPGSEVIGMDE
jgi:glycerol-3-phosphate acyltransferase PlsX